MNKMRLIIVLLTVILFVSPSVFAIDAFYDSQNKDNINISLDVKHIYLRNHTGCYKLMAYDSVDSFQMYCHIPIIFEGQSPVIINNVWTEPVNRVINFEIANDYSSLNSLLKVTLSGINKNEILRLFWSGSVILKENTFGYLPEEMPVTPRKNLPNEVKKWLLPSDFIQSDHWRIKLRARMLKGTSNNVIEIAERIANFTANEIQYEGGIQDALYTLKTGKGVCTGKANLAAALLRANGIPARILFVYPMHFIVEYYVNSHGWIRMESTIGEMPYPAQKHTVQFSAFPWDETGSNTINGRQPYGGVIGYWGTSNSKVVWLFDYFNPKRTTNTTFFSSDTTSINDALNITNKVWDYYDEYLNKNLSNRQENHFLNATFYQKTAISCFEQENLEGYIENMTFSLAEYQLIEEKFRGIAIGSDIIGDESSISELLTFIEDCNINNVIVDFGWITWSWENTKFEEVSDFINKTQQRNISVWLMYRARTYDGDGHDIPHQVNILGDTSSTDICISSKKSRDWAISWSDKLLQKYPTVDGMILYNPRILSNCCYNIYSTINFVLETKTRGLPRLFRQATEKYDLWMEWRCNELKDFLNEWTHNIKCDFPDIKTGSVLLSQSYGSYNTGQDISRLETFLDIIFPFVALDNVDNNDIAGEICNETKEQVSCGVVSDIKIYGPYNNTDTDIVNAIQSSMESNGDGFFIWCYDFLNSEEFNLSKIIDAYNGIYL